MPHARGVHVGQGPDQSPHDEVHVLNVEAAFTESMGQRSIRLLVVIVLRGAVNQQLFTVSSRRVL